MMKKVVLATMLAAVSVTAVAQSDSTTFKCKPATCVLTCNVNGQTVAQFEFNRAVKITRQQNGTNSYFMFSSSKDVNYDAVSPQSCFIDGDLEQQK